MSFTFQFPYSTSPACQQRVAYCCMEFAIEQPLKLYAGGLGFLAGAHLRSAYDLKQPLVGIGILWKYGYYYQTRKADQTMAVLFEEKIYGFLQPTDLRFKIQVSKHDVWVTAYYLPPTLFNTAPLFLLSTDLPENDYLARTISHRLYDPNPETSIAASILLGAGAVKLLELLGWQPQVYHLNESHALPLAFYLYNGCKDIRLLKQRLVYTNHTPEESGNRKSDISLLDKMGFFCGIPITEVRAITQTTGNVFDHTLSALRLAGLANGVSALHSRYLQTQYQAQRGICAIQSITNAQHFGYWHDKALYAAMASGNDEAVVKEKAQAKRVLFEEVADQCGEIYDEKVITIVFAKRFAGYKRAGLLLQDRDRFHRLVTNRDRPVQLIWAGKPYPMDYNGIGLFDQIVNICKDYPNCAILTGYELKVSRLLKRGADVWLNTPRIGHEASGTSGMSAAMNGAMNVAIADGWFPEFAKDKVNSFVIPAGDANLPEHQQDDADALALYETLEKEVIPMYYDFPARWLSIIKQAMQDIYPMFDSNRLVMEYYEKLYGPVTL
ncbi:MAG: alpha-glucan family phosphorylase [Niastella sp.]|nr:alpha-glucan family phosphorylase [Niastella sp.]